MNTTITKLWDGTRKGLKWMAIQFLILLAVGLLYYLGLLAYARFTNLGLREALLAHPLFGKAGAYDWRAGLCLAIPVYSLLFGWWHAFFPGKERWWTYVFPWFLLMVLCCLHVAHERDAFRIITVDRFLLAGWLAPLLGILLHCILFLPNGYFCSLPKKP